MPIPFEKILDALNSTILCLDTGQRVRYINSTGEILFDASASSLLGKHFPQLLSAVEISTISHNLDRFNRQHQTITEHEATLTLANGRSISADYSIYPLDSNDQETFTLIEIRPLERQVEIARDQQSHMQKQASQLFARGVAHEIKNPLGGIRGAAQLLGKEIPQSNLKEYTDVIISEVDRLQVLIDNMLGPVSTPVKSQVNILEILEHIRKLLQTAEPNRFEFHRDYDPSIPEILADRGLLIQAFLNIALNAVQALEGKGKITFKTRIGRQVTIGRIKHPLVIQIDIIDNGKGISSEIAETIFLPMVTDSAEGTGLGLPIAQEIISQHGGIIKCQGSSEETTFSVILPLEQA
ncbi:MAG: nitrogen regulation protein NR(II) [Gammaproteobacteria bacterium]|nr:nitrogen regulation protein NR(II) [Gammaproteobacteria bacterium]